MRVLVNALSLGWLSGKHVLFGHLRQLATKTANQHEFFVLHRPDTSISDLADLPNVSGWVAPNAASHWTTRLAWEPYALPKMMKSAAINLYFTPTGTILPSSPVPQVTLAQNPWCMVPGLQRGLNEKFKAWLQRRAYRRAFTSADLMVYNSQHMRDLYQANAAGQTERRHLIAYQGIDDSTHTAAAAHTAIARHPLEILAVSVMAHWKGAEVVVAAIAQLHAQGVPAKLKIVGPWADLNYRKLVTNRIQDLKLDHAVEIVGEVTREQLYQHYATAQVFCLLSRCESFGIPAVEAQAFGTPVVGSSICAMPEIGGTGGDFVSPDHLPGVTAALQRLLTDPAYWQTLSTQARTNAARFRWDLCSQPLQQIFELT